MMPRFWIWQLKNNSTDNIIKIGKGGKDGSLNEKTKDIIFGEYTPIHATTHKI
jgi:hypothetical protein